MSDAAVHPDPERLCRSLGLNGFAQDPIFTNPVWALRVLFLPADAPEFCISCWYVDPDGKLRLTVGLQPLSASLGDPPAPVEHPAVADQTATLSIYRCARVIEIARQSHLQPDFLGGDEDSGKLKNLPVTPGQKVSQDPRVQTGSGAPTAGPSASALRRAALSGMHSFGLIRSRDKFTRWETTYAKAWFPHDAENVLLELAAGVFKHQPFLKSIPADRPLPWTPSERRRAVQ